MAHFLHYRFPVSKALPRVLVALEAKLLRVLDFTDAGVRRLLAVSQRQLLSEPWRQRQEQGREALTQAIGRLAYDAELEGILVPSAAHKGGANLILFPANLVTPRSWLRILNKKELPRRFA